MQSTSPINMLKNRHVKQHNIQFLLIMCLNLLEKQHKKTDITEDINY